MRAFTFRSTRSIFAKWLSFKTKTFLYGVFLISSITSLHCFAKQNGHQDNSLSYTAGIATIANNTSFKETENTKVFNQETGTLLANRLELAISNNVINNHWELRSYLINSKGPLDYLGQTQQGRPISTETGYHLRQFDIFYDYNLTLLTRGKNDNHKNHSHFFSIIGLSYDNTIRNIFSTKLESSKGGNINIAGLNEHYKTTSVNLGFAWQYQKEHWPQLTLRSWYQQALYSTLAVDFITTYDNNQLTLDKVIGFHTELISSFNLTSNLNVDLFINYHRSRINKSASASLHINGKPVGRFHQPQRDLWAQEIGLQLSYNF